MNKTLVVLAIGMLMLMLGGCKKHKAGDKVTGFEICEAFTDTLCDKLSDCIPSGNRARCVEEGMRGCCNGGFCQRPEFVLERDLSDCVDLVAHRICNGIPIEGDAPPECRQFEPTGAW